MEQVPSYVNITFIICVIVTLGFLHYAVTVASSTKRNITPIIVITVILSWFFLISFAEFNNFFLDFDSNPPRLVLAGLVLLLVLISIFSSNKARAFILKMPLTTLTYVHLVRIPVEIVLWWLFLVGMVPADITFEGMNYDIIIGLSAPFAALFLLGKKSQSTIGVILWNLIGLIFLVNVVVRAVAATPYFISSDSGEIVNQAIFYFPFIFLPLFIVPVVFFSHLTSLFILFTPSRKY